MAACFAWQSWQGYVSLKREKVLFLQPRSRTSSRIVAGECGETMRVSPELLLTCILIILYILISWAGLHGFNSGAHELASTT